MKGRFQTVDYDGVLNQSIRIQDVLSEQHLARFIVGAIREFDLKAFYARYGERGGQAIAPEVLLGLLLYGYASGVFSSRKLERATYAPEGRIPFRYVAGGMHPDHDTIAHFRKAFLTEIKELFVQVLLLAQTYGALKLGNISLDGTKIHADASKSKAVSYKRAGELEEGLRAEVEARTRTALAKQADQEGHELPPDLNVATEIAFRQERLTNLAEAKRVMEERAKERYEAEQAAYEAKQRAREEATEQTGKKPRGREPKPPAPGARDGDQYNFTDPESRIMNAKRSGDGGFDQHFNAQVAVDQGSLLIVANTLSNHPNDQAEAIPPAVGKATAGALDCGYFNPTTIAYMQAQGIDPFIATGRQPHHHNWKSFLAELPVPPAEEAALRVQMAYKLLTDIGHAIYRLRKCTVEPVIGIIKAPGGCISPNSRCAA